LRDAHYQKTGTPRYNLWTRQDSAFFCGRQQQTDLPDYVITVESELSAQEVHDTDMEWMLSRQYQRVHTFKASELHSTTHRYDLQDAFYLPLYGFSHIHFPGPNISILKNNHAQHH
jgi:hypothetical protein